MRHLIDYVVGTVLPQCREADKVGSTVKAFMTAELPHELIELLEKIVLHGTDFAQNDNLQNLLILTAIKADTSRVMDYIHRLDNYHGMEIANIAVNSELYEEALAIFMKFNYPEDATKVMLDHLHDLTRAQEYAAKMNLPPVWGLVARAQMKSSPPLVKEAIGSFIKANDAADYLTVCQTAEREDKLAELVPFLHMARKSIKEAFIDNSLIYAYARSEQLADLEDFINSNSVGKLQHVGERCYDEGLYKAAKIIFTAIPAYGKLAEALVKLNEFSAAVDSARKAKSPQSWRRVMISCLDSKEYRLAQMCGLGLIVSPDDLEEVVHMYETRGHFTELIQLLESGTALDRAHMGIFTELGVQYAKHSPKKVLDYLQVNKGRINIRKMLQACDMCRLWPEVVYLYSSGEEYDSAIATMMEHPAAWDHSKMKELVAKVSNTEYIYRAANFYISSHPMHLVDLLKVVKGRLDNARVVADIGKRKQLPLIREYLEEVQEGNVKQVNNALNNLYVEEGLEEKLRDSINNFDAFDQLGLAQTLEKHESLEFRRIAAAIYRNNERWSQSVNLSKEDKLYKDAMETTAQSGDSELAEELLRFFVKMENKECFAACLYHCFSLIQPDVVMELAWQCNLMNLAMPFMIQTMRSLNDRVTELETTNRDMEEKIANQPEAAPAAGAAMMEQPDGSVYYDTGMARQFATIIATANQADGGYNAYNYYGQYQ